MPVEGVRSVQLVDRGGVIGVEIVTDCHTTEQAVSGVCVEEGGRE